MQLFAAKKQKRRNKFMRKRWLWTLTFISVFAFFISCLGQSSNAQSSPQQVQNSASSGKKIDITGKIVKGTQGYVIRGKVPKEVFPILNPNPAVLAKLAESGRTVQIEARIVLSDNVSIEKIDGKNYTGQ